MRRIKFLIPLVLFFYGCLGANFVRVQNEILTLGKTSKEVIVARVGKPQKETMLKVDGVDIAQLKYLFVKTRGGEGIYAAISPTRFQSFYYQDNNLVGYEFLSSNQSDSTFFEDSAVAKLSEGMHVDSVLKIMGKPHGRFIYPFVEKGMERIKYNYFHVKSPRGKAFDENDTRRRTLLVTINSDDKVVEITFEKSGKWKSITSGLTEKE